MRRRIAARALVALAAIAVAVAIVAADSERAGCEEAARSAFLDFEAPEPVLERRVEGLIAACPGSERLTSIATGLRNDRPRAATRLARVAAEREPESYAAWAVLAIAAPPDEARAAWLRARRLNPLLATDAGP